jgi:hypothetical protein
LSNRTGPPDPKSRSRPGWGAEAASKNDRLAETIDEGNTPSADRSQYQFHPLAHLFPEPDAEQLAALDENIRKHGLREPMVLYQGKILDGKIGYRACIAAGVEPRFVTYDGDDPVSYLISLNLKRRHLSESQRAMVAAKLARLRQGARTPFANWRKVSSPSR